MQRLAVSFLVAMVCLTSGTHGDSTEFLSLVRCGTMIAVSMSKMKMPKTKRPAAVGRIS